MTSYAITLLCLDYTAGSYSRSLTLRAACFRRSVSLAHKYSGKATNNWKSNETVWSNRTFPGNKKHLSRRCSLTNRTSRSELCRSILRNGFALHFFSSFINFHFCWRLGKGIESGKSHSFRFAGMIEKGH